MIYTPAVFNNQWLLEKAGKRAVIPVMGNLSSNNVDIIRRSVIAGTGITMLPEAVIHREIKNGDLVQLCPSYTSVELSLYALYPSRQWTPKKTTLFIEHLVESTTLWQS